MVQKITLFFVAPLVLAAICANAQAVPPFFSGIATAFEPQIGIVNTGVVQDVQAIVSHDMKNVTLNMQVQNSNLLALREFTFQQMPAMGIVGLPGTAALPLVKNARRNTATAWQPLQTSLSEIKRQADSWVLERSGMYRVADAP
jgi:hypothetical protein